MKHSFCSGVMVWEVQDLQEQIGGTGLTRHDCGPGKLGLPIS